MAPSPGLTHLPPTSSSRGTVSLLPVPLQNPTGPATTALLLPPGKGSVIFQQDPPSFASSCQVLTSSHWSPQGAGCPSPPWRCLSTIQATHCLP